MAGKKKVTISSITAAAREVSLGGKSFLLKPITISDYGKINNRIISSRVASLRETMQDIGFDDDRQIKAIVEMNARIITSKEQRDWMFTLEGTAYVLYLSARKIKEHEDITVAAIEALLEETAVMDMTNALMFVTGFGDLIEDDDEDGDSKNG